MAKKKKKKDLWALGGPKLGPNVTRAGERGKKPVPPTARKSLAQKALTDHIWEAIIQRSKLDENPTVGVASVPHNTA